MITWKPIPEVLTRAESKSLVLNTCTRAPVAGEVFEVAAGYWDTTEIEIVCIGIHSCNTYWFHRVGILGHAGNETVYMKDWENMLRLRVAKWLRLDLDLV